MSLAHVVVLMALVDTGGAGCSRTNWAETIKKQGTSMCNNQNDFISGFYRAAFTGDEKDSIELIDGVECCSRNSPWDTSRTQTMTADWWYSFDKVNTWSTCPPGYFLNGIYRTRDADRGFLHNIEEGRCSKPADHPPYYHDCNDHNVETCFNGIGLCKCNDGYYVTGLYKGNCNRLFCIETLRCCKPASAPEVLDELNKVKTRIMDTTMHDISNLANHLGYGWCGGCRGENVGEDFVRNGDTWLSSTNQPCDGYMHEQRLNLAYGDWSFGIKDIKYGTPLIEDLAAETIDSGVIYNRDPTSTTKTITRTESIARSITHTTTSAWRNSQELNFKISYTPPGGPTISTGFKFGFETSSSQTDENKDEQTKSFTVTSVKTIQPNSAAKWRLVVAKTKSSVNYTATIIVKFSTELQGFLRWSGGIGHADTNYHYKHRGSGDRPTFNYRFGDSKVPFYTALKRESDTNSHPWLWTNLKSAYPGLQQVINDLCDENRYVFKLTGKFEDVSGKNVDFHWDTVPTKKRSVDSRANAQDKILHASTQFPKTAPNDVGPKNLTDILQNSTQVAKTAHNDVGPTKLTDHILQNSTQVQKTAPNDAPRVNL
ncbi:aerolysin-4-like [Physella acuta]|uniref:aerolysin-4-like n=1 Tax=Physella acuta TaxID=109671 RepID=UPI0027DB8AD2|nr:aerolysin-4-like [Physella acuta]